MDQYCNSWSNHKLLILKVRRDLSRGEISPMAKYWAMDQR
jgi:hypothetical protein